MKNNNSVHWPSDQTISGSTIISALVPWTMLLHHWPACWADPIKRNNTPLQVTVSAVRSSSRLALEIPTSNHDAWTVCGDEQKWVCQAATGQQFAAVCVCFQSGSRVIHPHKERRDAVICRITADMWNFHIVNDRWQKADASSNTFLLLW